MAFSLLKNAGLVSNDTADASKTKVTQLASEKTGKDLYRQVFEMNNPFGQSLPGIGPLPQGYYNIGPEQDNVTYTGHQLPASMRLTPDPGNQMFGRAGFLIHGPHNKDNHDSSNGCPIFSKNIRDQIGKSKDKCFQVVQ